MLTALSVHNCDTIGVARIFDWGGWGRKGVGRKIFRGGEPIRMEPVLTTKNGRIFEIWELLERVGHGPPLPPLADAHGGAGPNHKSHAMTSSEIYNKGIFCGVNTS